MQDGFCGFTDQGAEFHHGLIEDSGRIPIQQCRCRFLKYRVRPGAIYRRIHGKQPGNHPLDISIHDRKRLIKGNAENCRGNIVSYPRKLPEGIPVSGNLAGMPGSYLNGGFMKITGPAVISQALPEFEHILLIRAGKGMNCRESFQKTVMIGDHGFNLGLLKHDFRNPDRIGLRDSFATEGFGDCPHTRPEGVFAKIQIGRKVLADQDEVGSQTIPNPSIHLNMICRGFSFSGFGKWISRTPSFRTARI